jgi:hypothetical protein
MLRSFRYLEIGFVFSKSTQIPRRFSTDSGSFALFLLSAVRYLHRPAFGFDWLWFPAVRGGVYFHNPFSVKRLHSFCLLQIGFVFSKRARKTVLQGLSFHILSSCFGFRASCFGSPAKGRPIGFALLAPPLLCIAITFCINYI